MQDSKAVVACSGGVPGFLLWQKGRRKKRTDESVLFLKRERG